MNIMTVEVGSAKELAIQLCESCTPQIKLNPCCLTPYSSWSVLEYLENFQSLTENAAQPEPTNQLRASS
jgi:hypothetical protein